MKRFFIATLLSVAPLGGLAAAVTAADGDQPSEPTTRAAASVPVAADLYAAFGATGRAPGDAALRQRSESSASRVMPPDPSQTRLLVSTARARVVGLASDELVCLHTEDNAQAPSWSTLSCARLDDPAVATQPLTSTTVVGRNQWLVVALVPQDKDSVVVRTDRGREVLPVRDSVVAVETSAAPRTLSWSSESGKQLSVEIWSDY